MKRLLLSLLMLAVLLPAAYAQQRQAPPDPERTTPVAPDYEPLLVRERPYVLDPETGEVTLTPQARAEAEARVRARREAWLAEVARLPRVERVRRLAPPPTLWRGGPVFTVDNAYDDADASPGDGLCATSFDDCTLRAAIEETNATPGTDPVRIEFAITYGPAGSFDAATASWAIRVNATGLGPYPTVTRSNVAIDGETQFGASCGSLPAGATHDLNVVLDGSLTASGGGLTGSGSGFTVRGLVVQGFAPGFGAGLFFAGPNSLAECNYVGTDVDGEVAAPNWDGIFVGSLASNTLIRDNLVSGNSDDGVSVLGISQTVSGNFVGTDDDGNQVIGNGDEGISVAGRDGLIDGNLISGNVDTGIGLGQFNAFVGPATRMTVTNNTIGLDRLRGNAGYGNGDDGIAVGQGASDNDIGLPGGVNYIASHPSTGIYISGSGTDDNRVRNNVIGLDLSGNAQPNGRGIYVAGGPEGTMIGLGLDGNLIAGSTSDGILIGEGTNTLIEGNLVGLNAAGAARPNGRSGITLRRSANTTVSANTVSANGGSGIRLEGASGSALFGNTIGLSPSGQSLGLGNAEHGILLEGIHPANAASDNDIGLPGEAPNRIADNADNGIGFEGPTVSDGNRVRNNVVGLDAAGNPAPNGLDGISLRQTDGTIISGNTVSANAAGGILLFSSAANTLIEDNLVGLGPDGSTPRGNGVNGIAVLGATGVTLRGNTVSDNGSVGVLLSGSAAEITLTGNRIGTASNGAGDRGNGAAGISVQSASDVLIGGTDPGDGNTIAFSGGDSSDGVYIRPEQSQRIAILHNTIQENEGLGIDYCPSFPDCDGVTPNDSPDADGITNYPVITSVENDGTDAVISLSLDGLPNQLYLIDYFRADLLDPSGYGEGVYVLSHPVTTNASGQGTLTISRLAVYFPVGSWVTATATPIDGATFTGYQGTSEFSAAAQVEDTSGPPLTVTITPTSPGPPVVLERGDRAFFDVTFEVGATGPSSFEFWTEVVLPNGSVRSPLIGPNTVNVSPPATVTLSFSQRVPNVAPFGSYTYRVEAGTFPGTVLAQDSFAAEVVPGRASEGPDDWQAFDADGNLLDGPQVYDFRSGATEAASRGEAALPNEVSLVGAYPNPFSRQATVAFALPASQRVILAVYDVLGREVATLADGEVEAGRHQAMLDGAALPSGVYLVRLVTDAGAQTQRLTLVR